MVNSSTCITVATSLLNGLGQPYPRRPLSILIHFGSQRVSVELWLLKHIQNIRYSTYYKVLWRRIGFLKIKTPCQILLNVSNEQTWLVEKLTSVHSMLYSYSTDHTVWLPMKDKNTLSIFNCSLLFTLTQIDSGDLSDWNPGIFVRWEILWPTWPTQKFEPVLIFLDEVLL